MYTYTAGATGLDASMPPWVQEGGIKEWIKRLQDPRIRKKALDEMRKPSDKWENLTIDGRQPRQGIITWVCQRFIKAVYRKDTGSKFLKFMESLRKKQPWTW